MKIERLEDIEAWQLARELTRKMYRLTKKPEFTKDYTGNWKLEIWYFFLLISNFNFPVSYFGVINYLN